MESTRFFSRRDPKKTLEALPRHQSLWCPLLATSRQAITKWIASDHEFDDERGHATKLIERMLFLEGTPDMITRTGFKVGKDVPEMLESDLRVEYEVDAKLREVIALCETEKDYVTRDMLIVLLDDTEMDHAHWLEQQIGLIKRLGLQNYLQSQM